MRRLAATIVTALPGLGNVLLLLAFFLIIFGVLSVTLTGDSVAQQCVRVDAGGAPVSTDGSGEFGYGFEVLPSPSIKWQLCAMHSRGPWPGFSCPEGYQCRRVAYPARGLFRFDTVPWACWSIFIIISLERWSMAMYWVQDATSGWAAIYFLVVIFVGSFFVLNLTLAVRVSSSALSHAPIRIPEV